MIEKLQPASSSGHFKMKSTEMSDREREIRISNKSLTEQYKKGNGGGGGLDVGNDRMSTKHNRR